MRMMTTEELESLSARLSVNTDKLIESNTKKNTGRPPKGINNYLRVDISSIWNQCYTEGMVLPGWLDDLITGASRMNVYGTKPLNRGNILKVLATVEDITTDNVMRRLKVGERQAREYCACIRVIYPKLEPHVKREVEEYKRIELELYGAE